MKQPGRPPKLDDRTKAEIIRRLAMGEKPSDLRSEYKLAETTFRRNFSADTAKIREVGTALAEAELALDELPFVAQVSARSLADQLKGISSSLARAAQSGSNVAAKLSSIAEQRARMLDHTSEAEDLKPVAALMETANRASTIGMGLLNAGKAIKPEEETGDKPKPALIVSGVNVARK